MDKVKKKPLWARVIDRCSELTGIVAGLGILFATLVIAEEVIVRYVWRQPSIWQTELSIYLLMMTAFVGGAYGLKNGGHVRVDVIVMHLPNRVRSVVDVVTSIIGLIFCVVVAGLGWLMWYKAYSMGWHSPSLWGPSLILPYMCLPLGMTLISLQYLVQVRESVLIAMGKLASKEETVAEFVPEVVEETEEDKGRLAQWITSVLGL